MDPSLLIVQFNIWRFNTLIFAIILLFRKAAKLCKIRKTGFFLNNKQVYKKLETRIRQKLKTVKKRNQAGLQQ